MGRDSGIVPPVARDASKSPLTWSDGARLISHLADLLSAVWNLQKILTNLRCSRIRRPAGSAANGRDSGKSPPDRKRYGEIAQYLGRFCAVAHLMDRRSILQNLRGILKNPRGSRARHPAVSATKGRDSGKSPLRQPIYGGIATYWGRVGAISNLMGHRPNV